MYRKVGTTGAGGDGYVLTCPRTARYRG